MNQFNRGDMVRLNTGGPPMSVAKVQEFGPDAPNDQLTGQQVLCAWFVGEEEKGTWFPPECLVKIKELAKCEVIEKDIENDNENREAGAGNDGPEVRDCRAGAD